MDQIWSITDKYFEVCPAPTCDTISQDKYSELHSACNERILHAMQKIDESAIDLHDSDTRRALAECARKAVRAAQKIEDVSKRHNVFMAILRVAMRDTGIDAILICDLVECAIARRCISYYSV
jgi:hypothetical protein